MEHEEIKCKANQHISFSIGGKCPYTFVNNNFFFNSSDFLKDQNAISFYILDSKLKTCEGSFYLSIRDSVGYSPLKAPFGSIDINTRIAPEVLEEFLETILKWCVNNSLKTIEIKHYPHCYDPEASVLIQNLFFNKGFKIANTDLGQYIRVQSDVHHFSRSARVKINKCKRAGFTFKRLEKSRIKEVYTLLEECKDRKGYPTNMSLENLEASINKFPEHYLLFGVMDEEALISVSICVLINNKILYDFSHGHLWEYRKFSPVTFLIEGILDFCREKGCQILDLGLSTENSKINAGLFDFKRRLGTLFSVKHSYSKVTFDQAKLRSI